ncbi:MAG: S8 family serine peptidase, partial [Candidatus Eisenbacteria bacterium]|nr:S8 family serine peptidase [Candidatus Eisenbacteria bacterium]
VRDRTDDGFSRRLIVRAEEACIPQMARVRDVWWIEELPEFRTMNNTTRWVVQSNANGWMPLWDHGIYGQNQIITMMDTGLDYNSCWFRENGNAQPGPSHRKVIHYTTLGGGARYDGCDNGHGSHVAGTVCGDQSYINPGDIGYNGMAYRAKITVQDVGADDWSACNLGTLMVPSSLSSAFSASYSLEARAHTNSWGSTSNTYDGYCVDVDNAMWQRPDYLVLFAAGNSGPGGGTVGSPGTAKNCVTCGATMQAPQQESVASYSSRGPASDGRLKPTVMAPGGSTSLYIYSVNNHTGNPPSPTCSVQGSPFQGTSMATPAIAGSALNVRTYYQEGFYPHGAHGGDDPLDPSAALIKATLIASTDDMGSADIPNQNEGWGRILLDNALYFEGDTRELIVADVAPGLGTGDTWSTTFEFEACAEPLSVALVWTDYPGTAGSGIKLVNDLDLTVTTPGGTQYRGNVFSGGQSCGGGTSDRLNVEECVRRFSPGAGGWTVEVRGYNVPHGPQPFALVVCGAFAEWPPDDFSTAEDQTPGLSSSAARILAQPNPATGMTTIRYEVPAGYAGPVEMQLLDVSGRAVRHLVAKGQRAGSYQVTWDGLADDGRPVPDGVYFAKITAGAQTARAKVVIRR